jgi:hypothetical protein
MRSLSLRPGDSLITPSVTLSIGFKDLVSLLSAIQATGFLAFILVGLSPTEHTSVRLDTQLDTDLTMSEPTDESYFY